MPKNVVHKAYTTIAAFLGATKAAGEVSVIHNTDIDNRFDVAVQTDANAVLYESKIKPVSTVAQLADLSTTRYPAAFVIGSVSSQNGLWLFDSSNRSAAVTADPSSLSVVAPSTDTSGASGAWVNQGAARKARADLGLAPITGLPRTAAAFRAAHQQIGTSNTTQIPAVTHGDSVSGSIWAYLAPALHQAIGGNPNYPANDDVADVAHILIGNAGFTCTATGAVTIDTAAFDYWVNGTVLRATGGVVNFMQGPFTPTFGKMYLFWCKEAGAGSFDLVVGGSTVATYNADNGGAAAIGYHLITQTTAQTAVAANVTGTVRFLLVTGCDTRDHGLWNYPNGISGQALNDQLAYAKARTLYAEFLAVFDPHIFSFCMKESSSWLATELVKLGDILTAGCPLADKIFCAANPYTDELTAATEADMIIQNEQIKAFVLARDTSYKFFDLHAPYGDIAQIDALDLMREPDDIHPTSLGAQHAAVLAADALAIGRHPHHYSPQPVNAQLRPSYLGMGSTLGQRGTFFGGVEKIIRFPTANDAFGVDWTGTIPRKVEWKDQTGAIVFRMSNLSGVAAGWESLLKGNLVSHAANTGTIGTAAIPYQTAYFQSAPTITSDRRMKQNIAEISEAVLRAWSRIKWREYRLKSEVAASGDAAFIRMGLIAQEILEAFAAENLDALDYGLLNHHVDDGCDLVPDTATGELVKTPAREPSDYYSVVYDECFAVEAAYQRRRLDRIEARMS
jgi:hypothetical protein